MTTTLDFVHRFEPGEAGTPLLLLHGTGGDENDLLPLGRAVAPGAALLSLRGPVLEHGMPRFFRRLAEGVFDEADVKRRAADLAAFVTEARRRYGMGAPFAVGFSNGANIAAAVLLLHPGILAGAVLLRPMVPLAQAPAMPLGEPPTAAPGGTPVLMVSGQADPIVPVDNPRHLAAQLTAAGAAVDHRMLPAGHGLTSADVSVTAAWLAAQREGAPPSDGQTR